MIELHFQLCSPSDLVLYEPAILGLVDTVDYVRCKIISLLSARNALLENREVEYLLRQLSHFASLVMALESHLV